MDHADGPEPSRGERGSADRATEEAAPVGDLETEPFDLVTEETRAAILRALAAHQAANPADPTLSFARLRAATGAEDSGNFNYHLDKLRPEYVTRVGGEYRLTFAGLTLEAGVGGDTERGPEPLEATCSICEAPLEVAYEDGMLSIGCENDHTFPHDGLPPNAVEGRALEAAAELQTCRTQHHCELVRQGVCPACYDDVDPEHRTSEESPATHVLVATCDDCGMVFSGPIGMFLFRDPAIVAFYHDHGVNVYETPFWVLDLTLAEPTVVDRDPLRLSLSIERDGERLTLALDAEARVLDAERSSVD